MKEKEILPEIINLKPDDTLVEYTINTDFTLKNQCSLRGINHIKFSQDYNMINNKRILIITIGVESKLKTIKKVISSINKSFYSKIYLILDFNNSKKLLVKNKLSLIKFFFIFNLNYNPVVICRYKKQIFADNLLVQYPNYLNKFFPYSLKLWIKKIINCMICVFKEKNKLLIYRIKSI